MIRWARHLPRPRRRQRAIKPFASGGGGMIAAILATFALMFVLSVVLSLMATEKSRGRAKVVEVAARQRTLAERYVGDVLLVHSGRRADPASIGTILEQSAEALLNGGEAPGVHGDDDETKLAPASGTALRAQLTQEVRLANDLTAVGAAILANHPANLIPLTGGEQIAATDPIERLRVIAALTSNTSFNATGTIASEDDRNISNLLTTQVALGAGGLVASLLLAWALVATLRRRTMHFRSLVNFSTDLVVVLGRGGCRYASRSLSGLVGRPKDDLLHDGFAKLVHVDDRAAIESARLNGTPHELVFRIANASGEWRHLEARVTDLRDDRHVAGVVLNARDISERIALERAVAQQAERDRFGGQLVEALEMADEESAAYDVVERAMSEISDATPMELLLSDSSRSRLERVATSASAGAPGCSVQSPFACAAVRRGSAIVFDSSEALNACPKLRERPSGACSAACIPVSFMGRALGVLHATARDGAPPPPGAVDQLVTLATQAGARIGTVRAFQRTQLQAATDGLTGLHNRRTALTSLRAKVKAGQRFAFAIADLDEFKRLNDTYGHEAGDRALRLFAQVCEGALREHDTVARWGGEEFALIMAGLDSRKGVAALERIRERLAESHLAGHPRFTASFGVADSQSADTLEEIIQIADAALYEAKAAGRDCVTIGTTPVELVDLDPRESSETDAAHAAPDASDGDPATGSSRSARSARSHHGALHAAIDEEDPAPQGAEIR
jgi:diguanylate cyclase (GGDEF)-like protein/PAS domain S-box-containing protein